MSNNLYLNRLLTYNLNFTTMTLEQVQTLFDEKDFIPNIHDHIAPIEMLVEDGVYNVREAYLNQVEEESILSTKELEALTDDILDGIIYLVQNSYIFSVSHLPYTKQTLTDKMRVDATYHIVSAVMGNDSFTYFSAIGQVDHSY